MRIGETKRVQRKGARFSIFKRNSDAYRVEVFNKPRIPTYLGTLSSYKGAIELIDFTVKDI